MKKILSLLVFTFIAQGTENLIVTGEKALEVIQGLQSAGAQSQRFENITLWSVSEVKMQFSQQGNQEQEKRRYWATGILNDELWEKRLLPVNAQAFKLYKTLRLLKNNALLNSNGNPSTANASRIRCATSKEKLPTCTITWE